MKFLIVLTAVVAVATCWSVPSEAEIANHWQKFKAEHGKRYASPVEETHRMKIFKENAIKIAKHNARFEAGEVSFQVGVNKFADMLTHEVTGMLNGYRSGLKRGNNPVHKVSAVHGAAPLPWYKKVDWRRKGAVTPVKNQGPFCGACWAFSATGALEGQLFRKTGNLTSLSEQNLIDCSKEYGNGGCNGGNLAPSFNYVKDNGGIDTEESYPYIGEDNVPCRYSNDSIGATITGMVDIPAGDESALKDAIETIGPVSVAIIAANWSFHMYKSGVYFEPECYESELDHAVLAVGYGSDGLLFKRDYWIVKNSWGTSWGEDGYIRMARNRHNHCGIASEATYPTV